MFITLAALRLMVSMTPISEGQLAKIGGPMAELGASCGDQEVRGTGRQLLPKGKWFRPVPRTPCLPFCTRLLR